MPNRGSYNRRTGKTTPRTKVKTHWGRKGPARRSRNSGRSGAVGASPSSAPSTPAH